MTSTKKNIRFPEFLDETKPTSWWVIVVFALFHIGYTLLVWHVLIHWKAIKTLSHLTGNLLQPTLWYNLISLVIIIGGVILWLGKLGWKDIGLVPSRVPAALLVTAGVWIAVQLVFIIASLVVHRPVEFHQSWTEPGIGVMLGSLIAQLFGNSLYEELAFRGFLLPSSI